MHVQRRGYFQAIPLLVIFLFACFWRFINFRERIIFNQDQARDATIALYSIREHKLPLIGPPSSAGRFSFGPLYYWMVIIFTVFLPFGPLSPWIGFTILSLGNVLLFWSTGRCLGKKGFALLAGLLATVMTSEVAAAGEMLNTVLVTFATFLSFYFLVKLLFEERPVFALLLGLAIGLAINSHFQAAGLLSLLILFVIMGNVSFKKRLGLFAVSVLGLVLSFLPVLIFNFQHHGFWLKRVLEYLLTGQRNFNLIVTWGSEITDFWPKFWGLSLLGTSSLGGLLALFVLIAFILVIVRLRRESLSKPNRFFFIILFSFLIQAVVLRYYRGPRSSEYLNVFRPFLLFLTVWSIWLFKEKIKLLGVALFVLIFVLMIRADLDAIKQKGQGSEIFRLKSSLDQKLKGNNVQFYNFPRSEMVSLPLFYLYYRENRVTKDGNKIGACQYDWVFDEETYQKVRSCPFLDQTVGETSQYLVYLFKNTVKDDSLLGSKKLTSSEIFSWLTAYYQ